MNKLGVNIKLILIACVGFLLSCDTNRVFEQNVEIQNALWSQTNKVDFSFDADEGYPLWSNFQNRALTSTANATAWICWICSAV